MVSIVGSLIQLMWGKDLRVRWNGKQHKDEMRFVVHGEQQKTWNYGGWDEIMSRSKLEILGGEMKWSTYLSLKF